MKLNNKGMTLVELVTAIIILGMAGTLLTSSFVSAMRIVNRATLYKNASSTAQTVIELQDETYATEKNKDENVEIKLSKNSDAQCTVQYKTYPQTADKDSINGMSTKSFVMKGDLINAKDNKGTQLNYREFLPGNYYFIP